MIHLTGDVALRMVEGALAYMQRDEERINALNVFPVPDGDTGTNMILTVKAALEAATPGMSLSKVAEQMARGALMGARGNSGTIVSQYFHGFYEGVKGLDQADPFQIAHALKSASDSAYAAVLEPKEGTILTVGRRTAEAATAQAQRGAALIDVLKTALQEAAFALEETTELLDVLKSAGVVDAGGEGLVIGFEGALAVFESAINQNGTHASLTETTITSDTNVKPKQGPSNIELETAHHRRAIHQTDDITFKYCTEFIVSGTDLPVDEIKRLCEPLGDSLIVVGSGDIVKVHIHTNRPGQALDIACNYGDLLSVDVENMAEQNRQYAEMQQDTNKQGESSTADNNVNENAPTSVGIVAVCSGDGFRDILMSQGVNGFVYGGQSMNPSAGDLLQAIEDIPNQDVILLPNNRNIALTAKQAAKMTDKRVLVLPTKNLAEAVSATFDFDSNSDVDTTVSHMTAAVQSVRAGEVTIAVRDAVIGSFRIQQGDFLGLVDGELVAAHNEIDVVLNDLVAALSPQAGELITMYAGQDVDKDTLDRHQTHLSRLWSRVDVEAYVGGQPIYHYVIAVE